MIVVVGGGITGLAVGLELQKRGVDFVILEASSRPGGVIRSHRLGDRILDWGPQRARLTQGILNLVRELNLEDAVIPAAPGLDLFIFKGGRLRRVPFSAGAFFTSDIVGWSAKARLLLEPFTRRVDSTERVGAFFRRKVGDDLYETLIAPLYGGLYGSDPDNMEVGLSLIHVLREFDIGRSLLLPLLKRGGRIRPPAACTFEGGMETLPRAMAEALGDRLRLDSPVTTLDRTGSHWTVRLSGETLEAHRVVLTTPAPVAASLLEATDPTLAAAARSLRYNPLAVVHLDAETELKGLGFQVAFTEPLRLRGVTFNHSLFGRRNLYTAYLGGARHPDVAEMDDERLAAIAVEEFRTCTGYDAEPLEVEHERMPAWDLTWRAIQGLTPPPGLHIAANWWSRPGLPGRIAEAKRVATLARIR